MQHKLSINLNFYDKFTKIWDSLNIQDRTLNVTCAQSMKKLSWLIFIMGKMKILNGRDDITELAFLLFATIYWAIMLCPKDVTCELIEKFKKENEDCNMEEDGSEENAE